MPAVCAPEHEAALVVEVADALAVAVVVGARTSHSGEDPIGASRDQTRKKLAGIDWDLSPKCCRHAVPSISFAGVLLMRSLSVETSLPAPSVLHNTSAHP